MNRLFLCLMVGICLYACKGKKKEKTGAYFSVVSYLQGQAKQIDTSLYHFVKIETIDSTTDTTSISKEDFRNYAKDFLTIPDISSEEKKDNYKEDNSYDDLLNNILLTYTTNDPDEEVRRETIMLEPDDLGNSKIKTIIINRIQTGKDSTIEKDLTWHVAKRFQVVTKIQKGNQPEKIKILVVKWE